MNVLVVLAHPNKESFNHAIARTVVEQLKANGHEAVFHDLYAEHFDPVLPSEEIAKEAPLPKAIENHCAEIAGADGIFIIL